MKNIRRNVKILAAVFIAGFIVMMCYFTYSVNVYGQRWFNNPYNPRLGQGNSAVIPGSIYDIKGELLAYTNEDGQRVYLENLEDRKALSHVVGDTNGKGATGAETFQAGYLLGFKTNFAERIYQTFTGQQSRGQDIVLTVDAQLQEEAYRLMNGRKGAVVVMNYKTGELATLLSTPGYDAQTTRGAVEDEQAQSDAIYYNRALQGTYPPGSVFKIITAAAAIENGLGNDTFISEPEWEIDGGVVRNAGGNAYGEVTLAEAFAVSCNVTFAKIAVQLGEDKLMDTAKRLGFNTNFTFKDLMMYNSSYPQAESDYELAWSGVGQGRDTVTPLHMAMIAGTVANGGQMMQPKILAGTRVMDGRATLNTGSNVLKNALNEQTAQVIKHMMEQTVQSGTATGAKMTDLVVGGKTGTAEVTTGGTIAPHSWYAGFIDDEQHPLCIAVVVENGGAGSKAAVPVAKAVLDKAVALGY